MARRRLHTAGTYNIRWRRPRHRRPVRPLEQYPSRPRRREWQAPLLTPKYLSSPAFNQHALPPPPQPIPNHHPTPPPPLSTPPIGFKIRSHAQFPLAFPRPARPRQGPSQASPQERPSPPLLPLHFHHPSPPALPLPPRCSIIYSDAFAEVPHLRARRQAARWLSDICNSIISLTKEQYKTN